MAFQRYHLEYAEYPWPYQVVDMLKGRIVFRSHSKGETIAKAQRLNNFFPIDGNEQTYGEQTLILDQLQPKRKPKP